MNKRPVSFRPFVVLGCAFALALGFTHPAPAIVPDDRDRVVTPQLTTIAGSGLRGQADGSAASASFLAPAGVAVAADGTIYVADAAAQNIRRIRAGVVDTYAGTSDPATSTESRIGGHVDGPTRTAKFDRPLALAVHGRTLYVVDAGNHCIRRIQNDDVRTIARNLQNPKGIAVADDGTLYVADDGVGIVRVASHGTATALALPSDRKSVLGVAVRTIASRTYLAYTDATHAYIEALGSAKPQAMAFDEEREPDAAGLGAGHAYGIAILNENTVAVSDTTTHAVRLVRFPAPPFVAGRVVRTLAGGIREGTDLAGAFADGAPSTSRLDTPTALALAPDGGIVVADLGNRRIRKIVNVDARESVLPDLSNFQIPARSYHIALVGNSYAFYNVLWPESIGGRIEAALARDAPEIGLRSRPSVTTFRIDAASDEAALSIIHEYLMDRRTNLIVLMLNSYVAMRSGTLEHLRGELDAAGVALLVVYTPQGFEVSPTEFWNAKRDSGEADFVKLRAAAAKDESYYNNLTSVRGLYLLEAMETADGARNHPALYYSSEHHLTIYGSEWVGRRVAAELERWKPWRGAP